MESQFGPKSQSTSKRKHLRFRNRPLHNITLQLKDNSPYLQIANISLGGVGILAEAQDDFAKDEFDAILTIGAERFNIQLVKIFRDEEVMGCRFLETSSKMNECIDKYFQAELLALNLNRVETPPTQKNGQCRTVFFHGQNNCELLISERNGQINYFSVIVLGNCIEIDPKGGLVIGQRINDENLPNRNGVFLIKSVENPESHIFNIAMRFVDTVKDLSAEYRQKLLKIMGDAMTKQGNQNGA